MRMHGTPKSSDLAALVDRLRDDLSDGYFIEVPHWDGDLTAIGLGSSADPRFLVYLSVQPGDMGIYAECEVPAREETSGMPYEVASSGVYLDYRRILAIVKSHLARRPP